MLGIWRHQSSGEEVTYRPTGRPLHWEASRDRNCSQHWGRGGSLLCFLAANYDAHLDGTSGHPGHIRRDHANP